MTRRRSLSVLRAMGLGLVLPMACLVLAPSLARGQGQVDPFYGSFGTEVPITVPKFRSITPNLRLLCNSTGADGWVGVGRSVTGASTIASASCSGGAPRYDTTDIYLLDGQPLIPCGSTSWCGQTVNTASSPNCTTGGPRATKIESYQRIQWDASSPRRAIRSSERGRTPSDYLPAPGYRLSGWRWVRCCGSCA